MHKSLLHIALICICINAFGQNIHFIENKGQWPDQVLYQCQLSEQNIYFESNKIKYQVLDMSGVHNHSGHQHTNIIKGHNYEMEFLNARKSPIMYAPQNGAFNNYYYGDIRVDKAPASNSITYEGLYKNIDLKIHQLNGYMKYDLILAPKAKIEKIKFQYNGLNKMELSKGRLILHTSIGGIIEEAPIAYQIIQDKKVYIDCEYVLNGNQVGFKVNEDYDKKYELVIDPTLIFSTYSGSTADNFGYTACFDEEGNLYSGSSAFNIGYPTTVGAFQNNFGGGVVDVAITKYSEDGTQRVYSTYIGGENGELPHSMIVNNNGDLIILGSVGSDNFPTTTGAYDETFNGGNSFSFFGSTYYPQGSDIFICKLKEDGTMLRSTFLGGSLNDGLNSPSILALNYADQFRGAVTVNDNDEIIIGTSTQSLNIPISSNAIQNSFGGLQDGYIAKLNSNLDTLVFATYLGGSGYDAIYSVMIKDSTLAFGGSTMSSDLNLNEINHPSNAPFNTTNPTGFAGVMNHQTFDDQHYIKFGSADADQIYFVDFDAEDNIMIMGQTEDVNASLFNQNTSYSIANSGQFISRLNPDLSQVDWSTTFGNGEGYPNISPTAFMVDFCNRIYVSGWGGAVNQYTEEQINHPRGTTNDMDITNDAYQNTTDGSDFYLMVLSENASDIIYGTYFGGSISDEHVDGGTSRFDKNGIVYQSVCAGCGGNNDFPIYPADAVSATNNSSRCNNGVFKLSLDQEMNVADFQLDSVNCASNTAYFTNLSSPMTGSTFEWNFGDGNTSSETNPSHTYADLGEYSVQLIIRNNGRCNAVDSIRKSVIISNSNSSWLDSLNYCSGSQVIGINDDNFVSVEWIPSTGLDNPNSPRPTCTITEPTTYTLVKDNGLCIDTFFQYVNPTGFDNIYEITSSEDSVIKGNSVNIVISPSLGANDSLVWLDINSTESSLNIPVQNDITVRAIIYNKEDTSCFRLLEKAIYMREFECTEDHIFIPNAFTPNNDGDHDVFTIELPNTVNADIMIYDRFGNRVYINDSEFQNTVNWDGTYLGKDLEPGVYVYHFTAYCIEGIYETKGNITLIR